MDIVQCFYWWHWDKIANRDQHFAKDHNTWTNNQSCKKYNQHIFNNHKLQYGGILHRLHTLQTQLQLESEAHETGPRTTLHLKKVGHNWIKDSISILSKISDKMLSWQSKELTRSGLIFRNMVTYTDSCFSISFLKQPHCFCLVASTSIEGQLSEEYDFLCYVYTDCLFRVSHTQSVCLRWYPHVHKH